MLPFYLMLAGCYFFYTRSKYFPVNTFRIQQKLSNGPLIGVLLSATAVNIYRDGWVSGILLSIVSLALAASLIQFAAVLGKKYFYGLAITAHSLIILDLVL